MRGVVRASKRLQGQGGGVAGPVWSLGSIPEGSSFNDETKRMGK